MKITECSLRLAGVVLMVATQLGTDAAAETVETVLYNGKIVTVDPAFSYFEAVAMGGGKIVAVGSNADILGRAGPSTRKINLQGRTVVPGFADNHLHGAGGGPGVDLSRVRTLQELLDAIALRVKQSRPGELIITNSDWHEAQLKEQRLPLRRDLDKVAPSNPVVVVRGGHEYILNSAALEKWRITPETPVPPGGLISRYEDGELNGELVDAAKRLVKLPPPPVKNQVEKIQEQKQEYEKLHAAGLTTVRHPGAPIEQYRLLQEMKKRGLLTMRVNFLVSLREAKTAQDVAGTVSSWGVMPDEGDEWLRIGGIKLGVDGGFEGGWMRKPYAEPWGKNGTYFGLQTVPADVYTTVVKELARLNWRVATHAVGDAAIDQVLKAYEEVHRQFPLEDKRWVIEHAFMTQRDQFDLIKKLGVLISAQNHLYLAGPSLAKYWGRERTNWMTPLRAMLDSRIPVSGGTDAAVIPYVPLWVIYHFVTRDTITGGVFGPEQRITRQEALRLVTINNAYLNFEEKIKGSIEPGKLADLVVLSGDVMTCPENEIDDLSVLMTLVGGKMVYQDPEWTNVEAADASN
ncbi:MAG: amidohydrolase [Acidobacteria bacterium]|nr:amidohydrolase [Acidobacteriota bacterium]